MLSLKHSDDIAYNGSNNTTRMDLYADTASDLTGVTTFDGIVLLGGSSALDISTGDTYIMQSGGTWIKQPSASAFSNVYTKKEIDSMVNTIYQIMMYYHTTQESDDGTITFYAFAGFVGSLKIYGNGQQTGTPTPVDPIQPEYVGTLSGADWTIPITCAEQTTTVNLGTVQTVRRIKKLVLTGEEDWRKSSSYNTYFLTTISDYAHIQSNITLSTHFPSMDNVSAISGVSDGCVCWTYDTSVDRLYFRDDSITSLADFKAYLAAQYAAGTPVTIWYVLATPETATANEPLCKIGTYADELSLTDSDVSIPITDGENTLTVDTDLPPSRITISGE